MEELDLHHIFSLGLILVMIAAGTTAIAKKCKQPYPIVLVIVGTIIGLIDIPLMEPFITFITEEEVFHFVVITLFLPALLGEAALKLPSSQLNENKKPIIALVLIGILVSFGVIGFSSMWVLQLSIPAAFVFAAVMSATDPVSVLSIFKTVGVNERLSTVIEGESLFNDGVAVVLFNISAFSLLTYTDLGMVGAVHGLWEFVKVVSLGFIIGGALGYVVSLLTKYFDDYPLEILFSLLLFYGSFILAETIHASGVIAVVTAALILGNYGAEIGMSPATKLNISSFWDVAALLANSLVFLMVGLEITRIDITDKWGLIFAAIVIVLLARSAAVYSSLFFVKEAPPRWMHILNWGGLKGSLSIALVLSLPRDFTGREELLIMAFSVVLFSLVGQGLTIKPLISLLGVNKKAEGNKEFEALLARVYRYKNAAAEITRVKENLFLTDTATREILDEYENTLETLQEEMEHLFQKHPHLKEKQQATLLRHSLYAQHEAVERLLKEDIISNEAAEQELDMITNKLVELESD
ncbi:cation:proton antiporter [Salibacterium halotolerans]|uniref:Monovalent cation:H+ antiporter, CPA1 family n=1 Tax=Salibacterium halotolerans TaxID=1884432 RepID=A0A1I5Y7N3_9BACI|nr:cation:proton antiporter [Salibacterium halotolerans]SFQ40252.1 monovalent cation:H+ antiporter, CPA1 family [Salibacterium halotolerans]